MAKITVRNRWDYNVILFDGDIADLRSANLSGADLRSANFRRAGAGLRGDGQGRTPR